MFLARAGSRFGKNASARVGAVIVAGLLLFAIVGPLLAHHDPLVSDFDHGIGPNRGPVGPSRDFLLGADLLFRDEFARLAYGARISLLIALAATTIASLIGGAVGILAGYHEGSAGVRVPWVAIFGALFAVAAVIAGRPAWALIGLLSAGLAAAARGKALFKEGPRLNLDVALMRLVDIGLAFPFLLLVMAIGAALDKTTATTILVTLGLTGWLGMARLLRAKTLQVRNLDFVVASRALGQSTPLILWRHILPNVAGPLIVIATVSVAQMIVAESVLSFLGVGLSPPTPTWGHMLFEGQDYLPVAPWLALGPGLAILIAVFGFNLLGEGLRDALDPKED